VGRKAKGLGKPDSLVTEELLNNLLMVTGYQQVFFWK
jgi:hypothetical protein